MNSIVSYRGPWESWKPWSGTRKRAFLSVVDLGCPSNLMTFMSGAKACGSS